MNRRPVDGHDSDDSQSDWDSTVTESPTHQGPSQPIGRTLDDPKHDYEGDYATILPKSRKNKKDSKPLEDPAVSFEQSSSDDSIKGNRNKAIIGSRHDNAQILSGAGIVSPPPHLTSFQGALSSGYSSVYEVKPDIPARVYEGRGQLYTVPEGDSPPPVDSKWNDSDEEERVLREFHEEREKQKKLQALAREKKSTSADRSNSAIENQGFVTSPKATKSQESTSEKWTRANEGHTVKLKAGKNIEANSELTQKSGHQNEEIIHPHMFPPTRGRIPAAQLIIKDATGKSCIFYFEEGSPHFVEVSEDEINAYLPGKVDEWEKLFRRAWREVFAVLRIVTSIFILFVVELILFFIHHIVRPLVLDSIRSIGDYLLKPLFTLTFNVVVQPLFALLWNTSNALFQALEPLVRLLGVIMTQAAIVVRAFRLFVINWNPPTSSQRRDMEVV